RSGAGRRGKTLEDDLPFGAAALDERMRALQVGRIDRSEALGERASQRSCVDQLGDLVQQGSLLCHIGRRENGAGEHRLPIDRYALSFENIYVQRLRIVDQ